jgi:uncharacterized repeat protein (TIGR03803 family)
MKQSQSICFAGFTRLLLALVAATVITISAPARSHAQTGSSLEPLVSVNSAIYSFGDTGSNDGAVPKGSLTFDGTTLFGRTTTTVLKGGGVIFSINPNGTAYEILHRFAGAPDDGANPRHDAMTLSDGVLYGTALQGGTHNGGVIFSIATDGTGYNILHDFRLRSGQSFA